MDTERIYMNDCERWETESGHEYRSGDAITVKANGEWITTRVECRRGQYILYGAAAPICDGMEVREDW